MQPNTIIFADLSTYTPQKTIAFYESVFDWKYYADAGYYIAYKGDREVVGLYETPEKFKQMRMPHFWMTYIQVDDVAGTVEKARALGGIIELVDESNPVGSVALIRDPQGAGFTIYGGDQFQTRTEAEANTLVWNELHVSDMSKIIPFYQGIFDWTFQEVATDQYQIHNSAGTYLADASQIPNEYKGKYEYWVCTFGVSDSEAIRQKILALGGQIVSDEGAKVLFTDDSGQAFFYVQEVK